MMATETEMRIIDLALDDREGFTIGGKAAGLAPLVRVGLPVPPAVVIPAEAVDSDIGSLAADVTARFPGTSLAVRSSGVAEDLAEASYAGQYETVLNVRSEPEALAAAIRQVRASAVGAAVASYAGSHPGAMAVLVMPMVDADAAGIAFTRDPVTGERVVVIEVVRGLGDHLASGEQIGERWNVARAAEQITDLGVLTAAQAQAVADLALRCERETGRPQDVEWAISGDEILLLQARPITALDEVDPIPMNEEAPPGPWEWDSAHNRLPMTPLTASVFTEGFERGSRRLAETYGAPIRQLSMRTINGYLYVQVVPPAGKPGSPFPLKPIMRVLFNVVPLLRRRKRAAREAMEQRVDRSLLHEWRTDVGPRITSTVDTWLDLERAALTNEQLAGLVTEAAELAREVFGWNMVTDPAYLIPLSDLHDFVESTLGGGMEMTTRLLAGASPSAYRDSVASLAGSLSEEGRATIVGDDGDVVGRLEATDPDFVRAYRAHLHDHGLRVLGFDLSVRTLLEQPDLELSRMATLPPQDDAASGAEQLAAKLSASLEPPTAARFEQLVAEARHAYPIREEGEAVHARVLGINRLIALESGRRMVRDGHLDDPEHVVFLSLDEITGWLQAPADQGYVVRTRRGQHAWAKGRSPEPYLGGSAPMPEPDIFPEEVQRIMKALSLVITHDSRPAELAEGEDGVAASPGVHTGPVRIVMGPEDFGKVQPNDVLVAPITASPWEVLFPLVGALVTEGGGLLSHPAIVAREYGLPAVVGCEGALSRFHDGQLVVVDGAAGTVAAVEAM